MNPAHFRFLLPCLIAGCSAIAPPAPVTPAAPPPVKQAAPAAIEPSAPPSAPVEQKAPARVPPAPVAAAKPKAAPAPSAPANQPAGRSAVAPLDLASLKQQLKDTDAIGVMTKLSLKNQVDDLLHQFRDYYAGKTALTLPQLRRSYEALLMKVLSLVQDSDTRLATSIVASREPIWGLLSDPKKFAALQV